MASPTSTMPSRATTNGSEEDAIPGEDTSEVTKLFHERLLAWRHACSYLQDYIQATQKMHHDQGKEFEKVLKTVSRPLKEGQHFSQELGGIAGMFENIRSNTQGISNSHYETAKILKGTILPHFERLHSEVKHKSKELTKGAGKGGKLVDKARASTDKQIQLLGQQTAAFDSTGGKASSAAHDPYVLQRGVLHRLNKQIIEENNNRQDLIQVQNSFAQFEAHVIAELQTGMGNFNQIVSTQQEQVKAMYGDMVGTAQRIPPDYEWNGFVQRNTHVLIDPSAPPRTVSTIQFPNQDHKASQPLIAGSLDRKGKIMKRYDTNYYAVTPSKYLHEFSSDDNFARDPSPEMSLYLPDCVVGAIDGAKFNVKGKDVAKGSVGNKFSMTHELQFKAHTPSDAQQWWNLIRNAAGQTTNEMPAPSEPNSPAVGRSASANWGSIPSRTGTTKTESSAGGAISPADSAEKKEAAQAEEIKKEKAAEASGSEPTSAVERKPGEY